MSYQVSFDVTIHDLPKYQDCMAKIKPVIEAAAGGRYYASPGYPSLRLAEIYERPKVLLSQADWIEGACPLCAIARTEGLKR